VCAKSRILAVDDNQDSLFALQELLREEGFEVSTASSGKEALDKVGAENPDIILLDLNMPGMDGYEVLKHLKSDSVFRFIPAVILSANDNNQDITRALDEGADGYITKPFRGEELVARVRAALRTQRLYTELKESENANTLLRRQLGEKSSFSSIVGDSSAMREVFDLVQKVLNAPIPVLISGESGTGKELIARAIHYNSIRKNRVFISQNCAAFSESLLESELFGHIRGAFTGAIKDREGIFQAADGGTLFLDEIGEMALALQAKLLRVLQDGTFTAVGENKQRHADVRIVAATNKDLVEMVKQGRFREDLLYRLNVLNIHLPPLRQRRSDIPMLANHFLEQIAKRSESAVKTLSNEAMRTLCDSDWPGNVRQLQNEMERAWILSGDASEITASLLSPEIRRGSILSDSTTTSELSTTNVLLKDALQELEKKMIEESLTRLKGNKSESARELGISRSNLIAKVKEYGLE